MDRRDNSIAQELKQASILHKTFNLRLEGDLKEFADTPYDETIELAKNSKKFINMIQSLILQ